MDEQLKQELINLVQKAMQNDADAIQQIEEIMKAAQSGDSQAQMIAQAIQQIAETMQQQQQEPPVQGTPELQQAYGLLARNGAKLNYIKYLRNECPAGYEMQMFKKGGAICKKCIKKKEEGGEVMEAAKGGSVIDQFRCGRKMKKKEQGGTVEEAKCGKKLAKKKK